MPWLKSLIAALLDKREAPSSTVDLADQSDIVARNGLNYGPSPDTISPEAKAEIERQRSMRGAARH